MYKDYINTMPQVKHVNVQINTGPIFDMSLEVIFFI